MHDMNNPTPGEDELLTYFASKLLILPSPRLLQVRITISQTKVIACVPSVSKPIEDFGADQDQLLLNIYCTKLGLIYIIIFVNIFSAWSLAVPISTGLRVIISK